MSSPYGNKIDSWAIVHSYLFRIGAFMLYLFLCIAGPSSAIQPPEIWQQVNPYPTGTDINGIVWYNNRFFAVGNAGAILTSEDAISWERQFPWTGADLFDIAASESLLVAVGTGGVYLTSDDGVEWEYNKTEKEYTLNNVTQVDGTWYMSCELAFCYKSTNGRDWQRMGQFEDDIYGIYCFDSTVLIKTNGPDDYTSNLDSDLWETISNSEQLVWAQSLENVDGEIPPTFVENIPYDGWPVRALYKKTGQYFLFKNRSYYYVSDDGVAWEQHEFPQIPTCMAYSNEITVIGGSGGFFTTSTDDSIWTQRNGGFVQGINASGYNGSYWIAASENVLVSDDAVVWDKSSRATDFLNAVVWDADHWVGASNNGYIVQSNGSLQWENVHHASTEFQDLGFNGEIWVAVGWNDGMSATSSNSIDWQEHPVLSGFTGLAWGSNTWAASSFSGKVYTSVDGETWEAHETGTTEHLRDIAFGQDAFIAAGDDALCYSADGTTWEVMSNSYDLEAVSYGNGVFVVVGDDGVILSSKNGRDWHREWSGVAERLTTITYGDNRWIATSGSGLILTMPEDKVAPLRYYPNTRVPSAEHVRQMPDGGLLIAIEYQTAFRVYDLLGRTLAVSRPRQSGQQATCAVRIPANGIGIVELQNENSRKRTTIMRVR